MKRVNVLEEDTKLVSSKTKKLDRSRFIKYLLLIIDVCLIVLFVVAPVPRGMLLKLVKIIG